MVLLLFVNESPPSGTRHASGSVVHSGGGGGGGDASDNSSVMRAMVLRALTPMTIMAIVSQRCHQWNGGARAAVVAAAV